MAKFGSTLLAVLVAVLGCGTFTNAGIVLTAEQGVDFYQLRLANVSKNGRAGGTTPLFDEGNYLFYKAAAQWTEAQNLCKTLIPDLPLDLLTIESREEFDFLRALLGDESAGEYWTSGRYSAGSPSRFVWDYNNLPVPGKGTWAPWGASQPPTLASSQHRVTHYHTNRDSADWRTSTMTSMRAFICELTDIRVAVPCQTKNDLLILLDSSGSIGSDNYDNARQFVTNLVEAFGVSSNNQIGLTIFSSNVQVIFALSTANSAMKTAASNVPYLNGNTNTAAALYEAINQYKLYGRPGVPQNLVVITDGLSNVPSSTVVAADQAKSLGLRMFSVGVGSGTDAAELTKLAGGDTSRVFSTTSFDKLLDLLYPVSVRVCPN